MSAAALTTSIRLENELADYANDHIYIKADSRNERRVELSTQLVYYYVSRDTT